MNALDYRFAGTTRLTPPGDARNLFRSLTSGVNRRSDSRPQALCLPWSQLPQLVLDGDQPWLITPAACNPHRGPGGEHVIPGEQLRTLHEIASQGTHFDEIAFAHELDRNGPVASLMTGLRQGPATCSAEVASEVLGALPRHPGIARAIDTVDRVIGGTTQAFAAITAVTRDPIIFGIVGPSGPPHHGELSTWYPLVAWIW